MKKEIKKTALVTGASRGIGLAIARQLGLDGYNVVMVATGTREKNSAAISGLENLGITVRYVQADISKTEDRQRVVREAVALFGRIDVLVNNAGVAPAQRADLLDMTEESFDRVIGINTKGNMFLTQAVAKQMISQEPIGERRGVIINISSCSSVVSSTNRGEYCVSKAGISMLTTLYADRLAREGILVHEVRPGVIDTDMTSTVHEKYNKLIDEGAFPIARWGKPEDVANAVSALASDKFLYTTGNYIDVDGGFHIKRL
ncbi:MAG: 3-ketoacyl-ACP reductase [Spirochaetales bacterium]|nr:3-ketoacyl-ACP reductase [Spirochaetales bacterium]